MSFLKIATLIPLREGGERVLDWIISASILVNVDKIIEITPDDDEIHFMIDMGDIRHFISGEEYQRIESLLLPDAALPEHAPSSPTTYPIGLMIAYRKYIGVVRKRGTLHRGETGPSYDEMDQARNDVLELLGANMPLEEIDHD